MKKVIVAGASGLIGKTLCKELKKRGYEIGVIARNSKEAKKQIPFANFFAQWEDEKKLEGLINGSCAVINLAGAPIIGKRWSNNYKKVILDSRIKATGKIVETIKHAKIKPKVFINGSAVGYYGIDNKRICDENEKPGDDFLAKVCKAWEDEAIKAEAEKVRVVLIRSAIVLDKSDGALPKMLTPFKFFVGGPIGSGKQFFPWIHIEDEIGIILYSLENEKVHGAINASAPEVVTNKNFAKILGGVLNRPSFLPVPTFALKLLYGEAASTLTTGTQVSSDKIMSLGYLFKYPQLKSALENILQ